MLSTPRTRTPGWVTQLMGHGNLSPHRLSVGFKPSLETKTIGIYGAMTLGIPPNTQVTVSSVRERPPRFALLDLGIFPTTSYP